MRAYTAAGDVIPIDGKRILQEHRFDVGSIVCRKKEQSIKLEIVTLGNPVEIKDAAGKLEQIDLPDFFKNFMKYEEEFVDLTGGHASDKHEAFQINVVKSKVCLALDALSKQVGNMDLAMQLKPSKKLTAVSEFKPEECILVPCTSNVLAIKDGQDRPTTAIPVDIKSEALQDMSFCLASMPMSLNKEAKANLNVPFWAVKSTAKIDEANMYSTSVPVSISLKVDKNIQHDTIHVPVLKNRLLLNAGDELKIFMGKDNGDEKDADGPPEPKSKGRGKGRGKKGGRSAGKSPAGQSKGVKRKAGSTK